ncbi:hypothetical protein H6G80_35400 [Nostoc sp. FACHB-87]|uniref:hypothetical protein n=1 Tax=Nostocales TaxID=1161 RepID=UPI00168288FF|nr:MULTISPECIES: hypothetical protein [Nostocales]MBD2459303.1 hypothetical protein [Nostoc sp. FACHB-87]MBD2480316.1 hypothetical protein [Anabaena sp. FACHB-83]MBD2492586.1 hypothetical protein [Aulosira sp. FACHB-615]
MKMISQGLQQEVDKEFESFWKEFVCNEHGDIDFEKVKRELYDYSLAMRLVGEVYCELAGVTKIHSDPQYIIRSVYESIEGVKVVYLPAKTPLEEIDTAGDGEKQFFTV